MAYYVNQYRQAFPTQFSVPTINTRGQAAVDAYNAGKADYENFAAHDAEMARAGYEASMKRLAAQDAWNAQQNAAVAHNQATNAGVIAIQQEIAQNEAEISKLKTELSQLTAQYGDADAMDRMLAANRARIGDMGNSLAHQQAINNRFQFQWSNKDKVKNQAKAVEKDIVDAYREYAYAEDLKSKQVAAYNIKTKLDEYKELTGKDYAGNPFANAKLGIPGVNDEVTTMDELKKRFLAQYDPKTKSYPQSAIDQLMRDAKDINMTEDALKFINDERSKMSSEEIKDKKDKAVKRQKKALASFKLDTTYTDNPKLAEVDAVMSIKDPSGSGENGTITRLKSRNGKRVYKIQFGTQSKLVYEDGTEVK